MVKQVKNRASVTIDETELLPWFLETWQLLQQAIQVKRLPHGLLLAGANGLGITQFARLFAKALLCTHPLVSGMPCTLCQACHWFAAGSHPDFLWVTPEDKSKIVKVDAIRSANEFIQQTTGQRGYRVVVINPASAM